VIVTVTPNPSVDRTLEVDRLERGEVLRATSTRIDAGGKGVNVTRALAASGLRSIAVLPVGGRDGELLTRLLDEGGILHRAVPVAAPTRTNITLSEPDGVVTKVNAPGQPLTDDELDALLATALDSLDGAAWLVGCGSLPDGAPATLFRSLTERAHERGARVAIDTSGEALGAAVLAAPDVIKPNLTELAELVGRPLSTIDDVVGAAESVRAAGPATVLVSLGHVGAVLVDGTDAMLAVPPLVVPRSDVGAGDTMLAGFLAAGATGPDALRAAVAWGTAAVTLPGTSVPTPADIDLDAVVVRPAADADLLLGGVP
jgi:1-phosphofructokinase